jgi:hypothetical protein
MKIIAINPRSYPGPGISRTAVTAVLVEGDIGDYAAYIGIGDRSKAEWIAENGDKLYFREAQVHFPQIEQEKYRL